jgi:hypothetical protein
LEIEMHNINFSQNAGVVKGRTPVKTQMGLRGQFKVEHIRGGQVITSYQFPNGIVNEGKNRLFDVMFEGSTQITSWYMGLIDNANYSAIADDDTYDDIDQAGNGWDEFQSYTDPGNGDSTTTRPLWPSDAASGQSISNTTQVVYDITATGTVKGLFLAGGTGSQTKGDHAATGVLWCTALFDQGDTSVVNGDQLKVTYTASA